MERQEEAKTIQYVPIHVLVPGTDTLLHTVHILDHVISKKTLHGLPHTAYKTEHTRIDHLLVHF